MKKIVFIFIFLSISVFSKYEKYHDEWDDYTVETACFTGKVYKAKSYYKNDELTVCSRAFEEYIDVAFVRLDGIYANEVEIKFDDSGIFTTGDFERSESKMALYFGNIDSFYITENMKKGNFMYVKIDETVYKISLSGFTKDFNNFKNGKTKLANTGKAGLNYQLYSLDEDRKAIFSLFDDFWLEYEAYDENDLYTRIDTLFQIMYSINSLEKSGHRIDVQSRELIHRLIEDYIHEDDKETFGEFYEFKIFKE